MNREDTTAEYTWSVRSRPDRSRAAVNNPIGSVSESSLFDHIYEVQPTFVPDAPGEYVLVIEAVGEFTDGTAIAYATVQHAVRVSVSGTQLSTASSGCNASAVARSNGLSWVFLFLFLMVIQLRKSGRIVSYEL